MLCPMDGIFRKIVSHIVFALIRIIKNVFLVQNGMCRFNPTCSAYAVEVVKKHPLHKAIFLIVKRVLRCHPFSRGGYDPVPEK